MSVTFKEIMKEMSNLYRMLKLRNNKVENDGDDYGEVILANVEKNIRELATYVGERAF